MTSDRLISHLREDAAEMHERLSCSRLHCQHQLSHLWSFKELASRRVVCLPYHVHVILLSVGVDLVLVVEEDGRAAYLAFIEAITQK